MEFGALFVPWYTLVLVAIGIVLSIVGAIRACIDGTSLLIALVLMWIGVVIVLAAALALLIPVWLALIIAAVLGTIIVVGFNVVVANRIH